MQQLRIQVQLRMRHHNRHELQQCLRLPTRVLQLPRSGLQWVRGLLQQRHNQQQLILLRQWMLRRLRNMRTLRRQWPAHSSLHGRLQAQQYSLRGLQGHG
jgi:hypothetical protein